MEDRVIAPFERMIDVIVEQRVDIKVFPSQLKVLSIHFDSIRRNNGENEKLLKKTDKLYQLLLNMLQHSNDEIYEVICSYIARATSFLSERINLFLYVSNNIQPLLSSNYERNVSIVLKLLTLLMSGSRKQPAFKQEVFELITTHYVLLFNLPKAIGNNNILSPLKECIITVCKESDSFTDIFINHLYQLGQHMKTYEDSYKFVEFADEFISEFKYKAENLDVRFPAINNLRSIIFTFMHRIFFESNDELLRCVVCQFIFSKVVKDINYIEHFLPGKPVVEDLVKLLDNSLFEQSLDKELLQLLSYMCKVEGLEFMLKYHIEQIFLSAYKNTKISEPDFECISRCYLDIYGNCDIFMYLTGRYIVSDSDNNKLEVVEARQSPNELKQYENDIKQCENEHKQRQNKIKQCHNALKRYENEIKQCENEIKQCEGEIKHCVNGIEPKQCENEMEIEQCQNEMEIEQCQNEMEIEQCQHEMEPKQCENEIEIEQCENEMEIEQCENEMEIEQCENETEQRQNQMESIQLMNEAMLKHVTTLIDTKCREVSFMHVVNRLTGFFGNHLLVPDFEKRKNYGEFITRKYNYFDLLVKGSCKDIVKTTFETWDVDVQRSGLDFIQSLLNFSWGFALMIDSSELVVYLRENKMCLCCESHSVRMKILGKIANSSTFLSVIDPSDQKRLIDLATNKALPNRVPFVDTSFK